MPPKPSYEALEQSVAAQKNELAQMKKRLQRETLNRKRIEQKLALWENHYPCKGGGYKGMAWQGTPADKDGIPTAVGSDITERKQAEQALMASEEKFSSIFHHAPLMMALSDLATGRILDVNRKHLDVSGYSREEIIGKTSRELNWIDSRDRERLAEQMTARGYVHAQDLTLWSKDKTPISCIYNGVLVEIDGQSRIISITQDITERKQAEQALIQSERKWRNILLNTPQIGISLDLQARIIFVNDHFLKLTGWDRANVIGRNWFDVFIPECKRGEVQKVFHAALDRKAYSELSNYENEILTKSGDLRCISWSNVVNKDGSGNALDVTCLGVDLTEHVESEKKLGRQKRLFETMFNTIPDGVVITDTDRRIQLANQGMLTTFGYRPEELLGRSTQTLYADATQFQDTGKTVFAARSRTQEDLYVARYKDVSGREFSGETFGAKLFDENNQWIGNLGIMRDITEREKAEKRIQQAQKMESIGNLAGGIAHDFNNILFPILGMSEFLLEDLPRESLEYGNAQEILKAGIRGRDLVKQILAFSRQNEHQLIPVRIQQILKEVLKLIRATIPSYIEIHETIQPDCGLVMADPTQIHQVAMNILTNAFHAVEAEGGKITLGLKEAFPSGEKLQRQHLTPGPYAILSVSDTGQGILPHVLPKIFEPYFTTKEQGKGTGLGLAVAYGIIKEHKGDIQVCSAPGSGTTFDIYLPLMEKTAEPKPEKKTEAHQTGHERILLVDDETAIVTLEKQRLERLGYRVTSHTNSVTALEDFKADPLNYDLVLTDMTMPHMTGADLAEKLLAIRPDIPVIICTGFSERIDKEKSEIIGVKGFLMKPADSLEMAEMIRNILDETAPPPLF